MATEERRLIPLPGIREKNKKQMSSLETKWRQCSSSSHCKIKKKLLYSATIKPVANLLFAFATHLSLALSSSICFLLLRPNFPSPCRLHGRPTLPLSIFPSPIQEFFVMFIFKNLIILFYYIYYIV